MGKNVHRATMHMVLRISPKDWATVVVLLWLLDIKFAELTILVNDEHIALKSDWKYPVGAGPLVIPEALRISKKHLQSPSSRFAGRTAAEFLGDDVIDSVWLSGAQK